MGLGIEEVSALVTAAMSVWIAFTAHSFSRRAARVEAEREITNSFMMMNHEQWSNVEVADLYKRTRHPTKSTDYVRVLAQTRYRLGVLYQVWRAEAEGVVPNARNVYGFKGFVRLIIVTSGPAFRAAISDAGYNEDFVKAVGKAQSDLGLADFTGGVQPDGAVIH